jgi:AraC-like DNA-binding protein
LPDPAVTLAFGCHRDGRGRVLRGRLSLIGPTTLPRPFRFCPGEELVAIRLKLEWARPLLRVDPLEHANRADDAEGPFPGLVRVALPGLLDSRDAAEALGQLSATVRTLDDQRIPGLALRAVELVRRSQGALSMDAVAFELGTSGRQLRRQMRREVGIGLKGFARVVRFLRVVTEADRAHRPAWAQLAAEAGFADQAHFVRECRELGGLSPGELFRERRAQLDEEGRNVQASAERAA